MLPVFLALFFVGSGVIFSSYVMQANKARSLDRASRSLWEQVDSYAAALERFHNLGCYVGDVNPVSLMADSGALMVSNYRVDSVDLSVERLAGRAVAVVEVVLSGTDVSRVARYSMKNGAVLIGNELVYRRSILKSRTARDYFVRENASINGVGGC